MILKNSKVLSMLGLAKRAGKIADGQFQTETALKSHKAFLVIVAEDASSNTKKKFHDMCSYRDIPIYEYAGMSEIGQCIGKEARSALAVTDVSFADAIKKLLAE